MIKFFKDSARELKHVVWPTKAETTKYFIVVVITLILFWVYLMIADIAFKWIIEFLKNAITG